MQKMRKMDRLRRGEGQTYTCPRSGYRIHRFVGLEPFYIVHFLDERFIIYITTQSKKRREGISSVFLSGTVKEIAIRGENNEVKHLTLRRVYDIMNT